MLGALLRGLSDALAMFSPAFLLSHRNPFASGRTQVTLPRHGCGTRHRSHGDMFPFQPSLKGTDVILDLLFFDLVADEGHLEDCGVVCVFASCHEFTHGYYNMMLYLRCNQE